MELYNSLSRRPEPFETTGEAVKIYVCGITPYDTTHLGHAFTYASVDILIRYLEYRGDRVLYVQNVTDIDDDILRRANETGENWRALGDRWTAHYIEDMIALNVRPPDFFPRATDVIGEIISAVEGLLEAGVAYEAGGSVYYSVHDWERYGQLSRLSFEQMLPVANERGNVPDDPHKRDPLDFVLWQAQAPGEPAWDSPWGPGRPGWHIECSTMAGKYLGSTIDLHSGGADLAFPHHESEIAQMEAVPGRGPFSSFWMHVAMVYHEGEKMSKSLGNLVMVRDLLTEWTSGDLRAYLGGFHYREEWSHDEATLAERAQQVEMLRQAAGAPSGGGEPLAVEAHVRAFESVMNDDLNTPAALGAMIDLADDIRQAAARGSDVRDAQARLRAFARVFGLCLLETGPEAVVASGWGRHMERFQVQE